MNQIKFLRFLFVAIISLLGHSFYAYAQNPINKYGLKVISNYQDYQTSINTDSSNTLLNIATYIPDIVLDIKYATTDNFLKAKVYDGSYAFARKPVVEALIKVQNELKKQGYGLKIFDAYRPYQATVQFYEKIQDSVFVAAPWRGSRHNRACAIDLTIVKLKNGKELKMPTKFDDFTNKAHTDYMKLPKKRIQNRELLISIMEKYGFKVYEGEWWHFDFNGWEKFDLMDISFKELK
jgi:D-alanyl-D-alanine dipeptidase